jgi:phage/plasmid primase-like uncharacterized protein
VVHEKLLSMNARNQSARGACRFPFSGGYRERYPDCALLVASGNDHRKELELVPHSQPKPNVGKVKAEAAAVGGAALLPLFKTEERGSDWNVAALCP